MVILFTKEYTESQNDSFFLQNVLIEENDMFNFWHVEFDDS